MDYIFPVVVCLSSVIVLLSIDCFYKIKKIKFLLSQNLIKETSLAEAKAELDELKNRPKSDEILAVLSDMSSNGCILNIERIPPENVYFQAGGRR